MHSNDHSRHLPANSNVCLIGLMGSGKSTVGPLLARRLGYLFVDLDREIAASMGRSIREIFEQYGEKRFRHEEHDQLLRFCRQERQVLACGGGVVVTPSNHECLRQQITVYLETSPATLAQRVGADKERPLLKDAASVTQRMETILKDREQLYRACAGIIISTEGKEPPALVEELLAKIPTDIQEQAS